MGPEMNDSSLITVGQVVNTHGHRGEVRVWPLTDFPERFKPGALLVFEHQNKTRPLTIEQARNHKNQIIIRFAEIPDMNAAEGLKGGFLKVSRDELVTLPKDTYFIFEIIGMDVFTADGTPLGKVKDVVQAGAGDLYIVSGKEKEFMIPAVKEIVLRIDREARAITVDPPDGLLEL